MEHEFIGVLQLQLGAHATSDLVLFSVNSKDYMHPHVKITFLIKLIFISAIYYFTILLIKI